MLVSYSLATSADSSDNQVMGKIMVAAGLLLALAGLAVWAMERGGLPIGRLPGDIAIERDNFRFYFPLTTCLLVSAAVTAALWLWNRFR
jgi:formate hydrogenlyase subunit 3/multisubunit Na+/H+ antiporter MnhD subunit